MKDWTRKQKKNSKKERGEAKGRERRDRQTRVKARKKAG
jgi:hypothetical protein